MILVISHDIEFLNEVTTKTLYVDKIMHNVEIYNGNYQKYLKIKEERDLAKKRLFEKQQKEEEKLGTDNYISYDINLYSAAKNAKIEKLKNGLFEVSIPVPTKLEGKTLAIYYENSDGKLEEYEVVVNNGMATFKTNHFSVYTLSEKLEVKENNPKTGDQIMTWISLGIISLIGLSCTLVYRKRYNK